MTRVTLSRLENLAALVATWLMRYFCQATECDICKANLWTVSAIALAWIRGEPKRWKHLYATELGRCWNTLHHLSCATAQDRQNPADILSRRFHAHDLTTSNTWRKEPVWFRGAPNNWHQDIHTYHASIPGKRNTPRMLKQ